MTKKTFVTGKGVVNRRSFVKKTVAAVAASIAAPYVWTKEPRQLRVLGTHVTLQEAIRQRAQEDLGIELIFEPRGSAAVLQKAASRPESFDLYEQWSNSIDVLWQAKAIQPIEKSRIQNWSRINALTKTGKLRPGANTGAGDAPNQLVNVQPDGSLGRQSSDLASFLPYVHNVDSFGYNTEFIAPGIPYETESWGWLLDDAYKGKVGIINDPTIGLFDLALAAQSKGLVSFDDIGNIRKDELDELFTVLIDFKLQGHFSGFWNSVPESVDFMRSGRVNIESMFSPAATELNSSGQSVLYAAPKEGYRAWHGVMCLSSKTEGIVKDIAYEYMNWWLSGWPGAFIARQGYYISNEEMSRPYMSEAEWDYWYAGKPAAENLLGTGGEIAILKGNERRGGSYHDRFSNIAVWNTVMPTYEYSLQGWYELLSA